MPQKNLKGKSKILVFQIVDDKKLILEKNLTRKSKMTILGLDDHRAAKGAPSLYQARIHCIYTMYEMEYQHSTCPQAASIDTYVAPKFRQLGS